MDIEPDGIDEELGLRNAEWIAKEGVVYLHEVAMGEDVMYMQMAKYPSMPTMYQPRNTTVSLAENLKKSILDVPIIAAGGIVNPDEADRIIEEKKADLVAVGRALLADPHWSYKAKRDERITPCIRCLVCHNEVVRRGKFAACTVNPYLVREKDAPLIKTENPKRVMVVGGGPAGITAAVTASKRGNRVCLYEKEDQLGGLIVAGSKPGFKYEFGNLLEYFRAEVRDSTVELKLAEEGTPQVVKREAPDVLVIAIGGAPVVPNIKGIEKEHVVSAQDCLIGSESIEDKKIVIIGGGDVGCETAIVLRRKGNDVSIVEKLEKLMELEEMYHTMVMEKMLAEEGVAAHTSSEIIEIVDKSVKVKNSRGEINELPADLVVFAVGIQRAPEKVRELEEACNLYYVIGDAQDPHTIREAVYEGDRVGRLI
jgi:2-enoate reductase